MRLKLIGCEVLYRELCFVVSRSVNAVDVEFLSKGLHDLAGAPMRDRLQQVIDAVDPERYEAVVMGYALCGNGTLGLTARQIPLVLPRAHDCIAMLLGSRKRYQEYFESHSGVYYRSMGWLERGRNLDQSMLEKTRRKTGAGYSLDELIQKYGEDNGRYLYEELNAYKAAYERLTFIESGLEPDDRFEREARQEAEDKGWQFSKLMGDFQMLERLVDGQWNPDEFLVIPPGQRIGVSYDDQIIQIEGAS
ncbi:MAG: DUF1638 domain-containing protein [Bryobacteraceae bacterium]